MRLCNMVGCDIDGVEMGIRDRVHFQTVLGCIPHYRPELDATYLFEVGGSYNYNLFVRANRKDGKKIGKRESSKLAKQLKELV